MPCAACASGCGSSGFLQAPGRSRPLQTSRKTFRRCCSTAWPLRRSQPRRTRPSHRDSKPFFGFPAENPRLPGCPCCALSLFFLPFRCRFLLSLLPSFPDPNRQESSLGLVALVRIEVLGLDILALLDVE